MNEKQKYLLKMLKEIHEFCTERDITYFIGMGTLLGAVRNGGFLPWDDDADVLMPYDSWLKFKEACQSELPDNRYLGSPDLSETHSHLLPRYVSRDTTRIHACQSLHDDVAGEVVDIFILDPIADGEEAYKGYVQDVLMYSSLINYASIVGRNFEINAEEFKRYRELEREKGRLYVAREFERRIASHFDESGSRYLYRWQGFQMPYERSWFSKAVPIEFEDTVLMAPYEIAEFLKANYEEEWFEVPHSVNTNKHDTAESLMFSYEDALELFKPEIDRELLKKEMDERHYLSFKSAALFNALEDEKMRAKSAFVKSDVQALLDANRELFDNALEARDVRTLNSLLFDYITWQTGIEGIGRQWIKGWRRYVNPIYIDLDDDVILAALYVLLSSHSIWAARRLLDARVQNGFPLTDDMVRIQEAIHKFWESESAYMRRDFEQGLSAALRSINLEPVPVEAFHEFACMNAVKLYGASADYTVQLVETAAELFPEDGVFIKFKGDQLLEAGDAGGARACYLQAAEHTDNGLVLREITESTGYYPQWIRERPWAKAAGLSEWTGEEPMPLDVASSSNYVQVEDARKQYLFKLLCEVVEICNENGISYVLCPEAASALFERDTLPDRVESYAIYCDPGDMTSLKAALEKKPNDLRQVEYMGNSPSLRNRALRYHGADSVLFDMGRGIGKYPSLYVSAIPVEPVSYPASIEKALSGKKRDNGKGLLGKAKRAADRLANKLGSGRTRSHAFLKAMVFASRAAGEKRVVLEDGSNRPFDIALLDSASRRTWRGCTFAVPKDLDAYLDVYPVGGISARLRLKAKYACSVSAGIESFVESGALSQDFNQKVRMVKRLNRRPAEINKKFKTNFRKLQFAVSLKEVKTVLVPRKQAILEAAQRGDGAALEELMGEYVACAREFDGVGELNFDDELYAVLKTMCK